jgi:hypothetical protein
MAPRPQRERAEQLERLQREEEEAQRLQREEEKNRKMAASLSENQILGLMAEKVCLHPTPRPFPRP